jgi:hypothetical protein
MHHTILAFRDLLVTSTSGTVEVVSLPNNRPIKAALYLWPWRIEEEISSQNLPPKPQGTPILPGLKVSCLALAVDIQRLEVIRTVVFQNPVLGAPPQRVTIQSDPLEPLLLMNIFLAAKLQPRPCLNYVLRSAS